MKYRDFFSFVLQYRVKHCFPKFCRLIYFFPTLFAVIMCGGWPKIKAQYFVLLWQLVKLEDSNSLRVTLFTVFSQIKCPGQTTSYQRSRGSPCFFPRSQFWLLTRPQNHSNKPITSSCGNQEAIYGLVSFTFPNFYGIGLLLKVSCFSNIRIV